MATTIFVQFDGAAKKNIVAILGGPQDSAVWANQGAVPSDDPRYAAWFAAQSDFMKQYAVPPGQ